MRAPRIKAAPSPRPASRGEETLALQIRACALPPVEREYRFCDRQWRFDFAWPELKLAVEVQGFGAGGSMGGHQRPAGVARDCEKYGTATSLGWSVMPVTTRQVRSGAAIELILRAVQVRGQ